MLRVRSGTSSGSRRPVPGGPKPTELLRIALAGALAILVVGASVGRAETPQVLGCVWGPIHDVAAVQGVLERWSEARGLPPLTKNAWNLTVEGPRANVTLRFARGDLTLGWRLDEQCAPAEIAIREGGDYDGVRPDARGVAELANALAALTQARHVNLPTQHSRAWKLPPVFTIGVGVAFALGLLLFLGRRLWLRVRGMRVAAVFGGLPVLGRRLAARSQGVRVGAVFRGPPVLGRRLAAWVRGVRLGAVFRGLGLALVVALLPFEPAQSASAWVDANVLVLIGILPLVSFLWLVATGCFGYGLPLRSDWPAWLVFALALAIREGYARHGIQEIEIYFFHGTFPNRHSIVQPLLQMFLQPLATDPYRFMMHVGGVMGSLATLPLYLFVRQRTSSRVAAALAATFLAVHPIVVQMAPTDGPYSLLLLCWFSGLVLWTTAEIDARQLFAGGVLLGIAATCRAEGSLYLIASLLLVDPRPLVASVRRYPRAASFGGVVVAALVAAHVHLSFPFHMHRGELVPPIGPLEWREVLRAGLWSVDFNDRVFVLLALAGAVAGLADRQLRVGLGALVAGLVVVWPLSATTTGGFLVLHRFVPVCALQSIAAGIGAAWLAGPLAKLGRREVGVVPGLVAALYLFVAHRHEVREPNAITDEFWLLRNHLAPGGRVKQECSLLAFGNTMDTDIHDFSQVLPGIAVRRCESEDCVQPATRGGCSYYLRSLNCFHFSQVVPLECRERGRTPAGELWPCVDPRCAALEQALELAPIEERNVNLEAAFNSPEGRPLWPKVVEIGLYRVMGVKAQGAGGEARPQ